MLCEDEKLETLDGELVKVIDILGDGAHSNTYKVLYKNNECALRWKENGEFIIGNEYYSHISGIIKKMEKKDDFPGVPKAIVIKSGKNNNGAEFGYITNIIPKEFASLTDYFRHDGDNKQFRFISYAAQINAALNLTYFMQCLHHMGLGINLDPYKLYLNCNNGALYVANYEDIYADWIDCRLIGVKGYIAPEIPRSDYKEKPSFKTDRYSLAIILYRLFFIDHPMEGEKWKDYPFFTQQVEDYLYAIKPVFHFNPNDDTNRPCDGYAPNASIRWNANALYTKELRNTFVRAFTEGIDKPESRPSELEWISVLSRVRDRMIVLDTSREQFVDFDNRATIPDGCLALRIGNNSVALYHRKEIYKYTITGDTKQYANIYGCVFYDEKKDRLYIRNLTDSLWRCYSPHNDQLIEIKKGQVFALESGVVIEFNRENPKIIGEIFNPLMRQE